MAFNLFLITALCVCLMLLVCGPILRNGLLRAERVIAEHGETINVCKLLWMTLLLCVVVDAAVILGTGFLVGTDRIFHNKYFTIVVCASLSTPVGIALDHSMKRMIRKKSLREAVSHVGGLALIVLIYLLLTSLGFAEL